MLGTAFLLLAAAGAQPPVQYPIAAPVPKAQANDPVSCHFSWETRSKIPKRICAPQSWWDALSDTAQEDLNNSFRHIKKTL